MSGQVVFLTRRDKATKSDKILMVIIATDDTLVAAGDPATMSGELADDITKSFKFLPANERPTAIQDLIETMTQTRRGYAHNIDVQPYVGAAKRKADAAIKDFLGSRADAAIAKKG